jgi:endoglucanase
MQDPATGGVYHKVSCHNFNALDQMPHDELSELVISPVSPTATAGFAAIMALASRFYPARKNQLIAAAKKAWQWCLDNPDAPNFKNPPEIRTGGYGDRSDRDERFWAACELFAATGDETFHDYIKADELHTGLGWGQVGAYGLITYLYQAKGKGDPSLMERMKDALLAECREIMAMYNQDPYGVSLGSVYVWGSNMTVGNNAMTLLLGRKFASCADYVAFTQAAMEHLHYLLGRNPLSQSYITGFGSNAAKFPHHRPSVAAGQAVPGMVVGGPNMHTRQDSALSQFCDGRPPSKCYVDHKDSYAGNEITIYWNSPVYFMAAVLDI